MANPPEKGSRRRRFLQPLQSGYDKIVNLTKSPSSSRVSSSLPGSSAALSTDGRPTSPAFTDTSGVGTAANASRVQDINTPDRSTGSTKPDTSPGYNNNPALEAKSGPNPAERFRGAGSVAFSGLEAALQALERSADAFPPLKQALSGLIACLDFIQSVADRGAEYERLTSELTSIASTLNRYITELGPGDSSDTTRRIARSVEAEVSRINKLQTRSMGRRMVESMQDREGVVESYGRIESLFRELQSDISLRTLISTNKHHAMSLLQSMSPVDDAVYNSSYSTTVKRRGCTAETRQKVQEDMQQWIQDPNGARVYWMNGMAGTGKTTIAYSVCEWLETQQLLGASFFCSRVSSSCRNVNLIVPTIAYQLALASPSFHLGLCKILETNPSISKLNVVQQFEKLIRQPLATNRDTVGGSLVVVVDALDECEDDYGVQLILGTLLKLAADLPLKFLITSRSEPAIQDRVLSPAGYSPTVLHLHDIEQSVVEADIKKYLTESLGAMSPPPSTEQIEQLAALAGKLFIYASTAVRYITSARGYAMARLNSMLTLEPQSTVNRPPSNRYKELDELYATVLASAFDAAKFEAEEREAMKMVLWTVVCAKEPMMVSTLGLFMDLAEEQVQAALDPLHSVLHVSEDRKLVSTLHASFPDYMLDESRSKDKFCNQGKHCRLLAHRCFNIMQGQLKFNICNLESSFTFDKNMPDGEQKVESNISPGLFYACQYWGDHLRLTDATLADELYQKLIDFLDVRLLFWMEVMNIKQRIVYGMSVLAHADSWLAAINANIDARKQATDAQEFVARFAACACNRSTPHIYLSALPFCARTSSVFERYWKRVKGLINVSGTAICQRDRAARATWKTDSRILSVAFSHDGARIIAGSDDAKVRVWGIHTGGIVAGPFEGHSGSVNSVAFSSNGEWAVSGSYDETIRVWNARTGDAVASPFRGHTGEVSSIAFSPDGTRIASGSYDRTIRIWYARTGITAAGPFRGHAANIRSVAFSPDGTRVASGSDDRTVRVWGSCAIDILAGLFEGHTGSVTSVAFSPDGTRIVSGSDDRTIRIWYARTGDAVAGTFEGHTAGINCVAFSFDGTYVVSGSNDETIRVWNSHTGDTIAGPLMGHTGVINSVAFSPDATHIVSGSGDRTIRVWNAYVNKTGVREYKPLEVGHSHYVTSVSLSPDGTQIVSGSYDMTVRLWDTRTGNIIAGPFEGHADWVRSVAFSPDGTRVASGSDDRKICAWDAGTGNLVAGPFDGHTDYIRSVAFSPDGALIVSGSRDRTIRVWDARTGNTSAGPFQGHTGGVNSVSFSPDSTRIVSGSDDKTIRVWDAHTGDVVAGPFKEHADTVLSVVFSADGLLIASGSDDQTIIVWDAHTGDVAAGPFEGHAAPVNSVAFSPDGTFIVSGSSDQAIRVSSVHSLAINPELHRQLLHYHMISRSDTQNAPDSDSSSNVMPTHSAGINIVTPPSDSSHPGAVIDFECQDDGWVMSNGIPLFWTPPDLRSVIPYPNDRVVMGYPGSLSIDYQHTLFGERWTECYNSA